MDMPAQTRAGARKAPAHYAHCYRVVSPDQHLRQIKSVFHKILADEEVDHREDHRHNEARYKHSVEVHESVCAVLQIDEQREHYSSD